MTFTVTLTEAEMATCRILAGMRSLVSRSSKIVDVQMGKNDPLHIDEIGLRAEYAFCKHWNIFFDPSTQPKSGTADCVLSGRRFDIKATEYEDGRLIKTLKENNDVDCYALAIVKRNMITFPGYVFNIELCQEKNIKDLGHGNTYAMDQKDLREWKEKK